MDTKKIIRLCLLISVVIIAVSCKRNKNIDTTASKNENNMENNDNFIEDNFEKTKVSELPIEVIIDNIQNKELEELRFTMDKDDLKNEINNTIDKLKAQNESGELKLILPIRLMSGKSPNDFEFSMLFDVEDGAYVRLRADLYGEEERHFYSFKKDDHMYKELKSLYSKILKEVGLSFDDVYGVVYDSEKSHELYEKATEFINNK